MCFSNQRAARMPGCSQRRLRFSDTLGLRLSARGEIRGLAGLFLLLAVVTAGRGAPSFPLQDGEHLSYRVSWAIVAGAGEIKVEAHLDPAVPDRLVVTTTTATRRLARLLLPFEATANSVYDLASGKLQSLDEASTVRAKQTSHQVAFDYASRAAIYTPHGEKSVPRTLALPAGDPTDLILGLLQTRSWNLKPGESRDALVLWDDEFYELTVHAVRDEEVGTPLGKFNTIVLEPRMEKTAPKGMFKRGSSVRVWITQDDRRLPVKFEVEFKIGTGTATLDAYQPPLSARLAAVTPDAKDPRP